MANKPLAIQGYISVNTLAHSMELHKLKFCDVCSKEKYLAVNPNGTRSKNFQAKGFLSFKKLL